MKCANCGAEIAAEDKYCYACGAEVVAEEPAPEPVERRCPEMTSGSLPEEMAWLLLPMMWFVQPLGWLAALLPGLYLVTRRNATAKFHGKALIGLGFLVIVLAFFLIGVLAFADIGID
jgi:hypothetical protein